jgi:hypothetical protein
MLFDPNYEKKIKERLLLMEFAAYAATKPEDEEYWYPNPDKCVFGQFLKSRGEAVVMDLINEIGEDVHYVAYGSDYPPSNGEWTWGAARKRALEVLAK